MKLSFNDLLSRSYSPYSRTSDAAVIQGKSGKFYPGIRVENIAFPDTMSAVQTAAFFCLAEGDTPVSVRLSSSKYFDEEHRDWIASLNIETHLDHNFDVDHPLEIESPIYKKPIDTPIKELVELLSHCVIPNSNFPVSALLKTNVGWVSGVNIELPNWRKGLCAERLALAKALLLGASDFYEMHVYAPKSSYCSPCGACRQVLTEHLPRTRMIFYHGNDTTSEIIAEHLLPYSFKAHI